MKYGERLRMLRDKMNLSQKDLTERLNINRSTYARYETSSTQPDYDTLTKLADFFGVTTDYLLGRSNQESSSDSYEIQTIAAHHDGDEWTEEEQDEIARFKEFVRMKRGNKQQE
ncbi:MAG: helix-turn-helix transcriptional regulator [Solibacillus sp.]